MRERHFSRREFMQTSAAAGVALAAGAVPGLGQQAQGRADDQAAIAKTRSYVAGMEYHRLGKTGLWVSAVCLGGHWKRIDKVIRPKSEIPGIDPPKPEDQASFDQNRRDVVSRCIEQGINLIDACTGAEVLAYAKALKGRREQMFLNYSWFEKEMRFEGYRTAAKLLEGLDEGLKAAELDYVDLWRVTCHEKAGRHTQAEVDELIKAITQARQQGKCRFTGVSSHDRPWLKMLIETYPEQIQAICSPYTADSKVLPEDSLFDAVKKRDVGFLGIKPFASNSLFKGDGSPGSPHAEEDDRRARLAIRYILGNPAITAPIPGLISVHQVDNVVRAIKEPRELDRGERAELQQAGREMWAALPPDYQWLREWQHV